MKKAIVTGISGQDGSFMCEKLLKEGLKVYGLIRHNAKPDHSNLKNVINHENFSLIHGDLTDSVSIDKAVEEIKPDYFINFAANSFVGVSWTTPVQVTQVNTIGVINCLEAVRKFAPNCRFLNMGSSEEFGDVLYSPQDSVHPLRPRSPYGASKASARHYVKVYRESYGIYAVQPWCFNHEGTRRGDKFVTRKITKGIARIYSAINKNEEFQPIILGNLESKRDWSDAEDIVDAVWLMLNQDKHIACGNLEFSYDLYSKEISVVPKEYVVSSGETHSIREFIKIALNIAKIPHSENRRVLKNTPDKPYVAYYTGDKPLIMVSPEFYRPAEVDLLLGDSAPIRNDLGWKPKTSFHNLVEKMVNADIKEYGY